MHPRRWRKMSWVVILFTVLMGVWIVAGAMADGKADACAGATYVEACESGYEVGSGIGIAALFCVWALGFVILSIIWFMTKPSRRLCPVCGTDAKRGVTVCGACGYNFATNAGQGSPAT